MERITNFLVPPETTHTITADEFIKAAKGEIFEEKEWFYSKKGREIKKKRIFDDYELDEEQLYVVLQGTLCLSGGTYLLLERLKEVDGKTAFIFVDCILPGIVLTESYTNDWIFIRTHMNSGIRVDGNSQLGNFRLCNSLCGYIHIDRHSKCSGIVIGKKSQMGNLKIQDSSECGDISIHTNSNCGDIEIDNIGECMRIDVNDDSVMGDLKIGNNGQLGELRLGAGSHAKEVKVYRNGRCGDIKMMNYSSCKDILAEINGEIGDILVHNYSQCGYIGLERNSRCGDVRLSDNSSSDYIWVCDESQCGYVLVEENSECGDINIERKSRSGRIAIKENSKSGFIIVEDNSEAEKISISDFSQCDFIQLDDNSKCRFVEINKNSLSGSVTVSGGSSLESLMIHGKSQSGDIEIDGGEVKEVVIRDNYCSVLLCNATVSLMRFTNCEIHQLKWLAGTKVELYLESCRINYLRLYKTSILKDSIVAIYDSKIYIVQLQKLLVHGQLLLNIEAAPEPFKWQPPIVAHVEENKPVEGDSQAVKDIYNSKCKLLKEQQDTYNVQLEGLMADAMQTMHDKPLFRIVDSTLGKAEIRGGDLTVFRFEYKDSNLLGIFINSTKIPKDKIGIYRKKPGLDIPDEIYYEQKISVYNQLKRIFENQGDIVASSWYHAKAMDNQQRLLRFKNNNRTDKSFPKWFNEQAFNLFNFWLNKKSNNYGESWRTALGFSLILLFSIYVLYFISVNAGNRIYISWDSIDYFIGHFISFIYLPHKMDFMLEEEKQYSITKFLDYFGRLATIFCSYQLISAFRRHGRRGG